MKKGAVTRFVLRLVAAAGSVAATSASAPAQQALPPVYVVPNFHPASCGWLADWSVERNYCANSYLDHLDRVRDDASYRFVISECNNMIAIQNFAPGRFAELKQRVREGRAELVNAFFLEPSVSLSGGEALAKMGSEGLRWQQQVMGVRPRFAWAIDTCGLHEQMPQICSLLGLEALVYTRNNPTGKTIFWSESPEGSRILTLVPGHYSDSSPTGIGRVFGDREAFTPGQLRDLADWFREKLPATPAGAPVLVLGGKGDYSLAPVRRQLPSELLGLWRSAYPDSPLRFATLSQYLDALQLATLDVPTAPGGTSYGWSAFWVQNPRVKSWYRRDEHALQAAETIATIASLEAGYEYPVQPLYHGWLQMLLNMDRNTLWGAAGGMVFEHERSWDARDRFQWVETHAGRIASDAVRKLSGAGSGVVLFNPLNWERHDPLNGASQARLPSCGLGAAPAPHKVRHISLPDVIETDSYAARIDRRSGALVSLKLKPSGREVLGGPANVIVAEKGLTGSGSEPGDNVLPRPERPRLGSTSDSPVTIRVTENPIALSVEATGRFHGGAPCRRLMRFYRHYARIDFETELNDLPDRTVVLAEFPLAEAPSEIRRGIPFGFSHGAWPRPDPTLAGFTKGILPAVRWSDYTLPGGGGVALLDRGLPGREIEGRTPVVYLYSAVEKYYGYANSWLSGKGRHVLEYALVPHEADWRHARIPRLAWEYNSPPIAATGCASDRPRSFLTTSDNVIVEVMRREGADIELRLVESLGLAGEAEITLNLPHEDAASTDLTGGHAQRLAGGPSYRFPVKPQQIVTLRFRTARPLAEVQPLTDWSELVPPHKLPALREYLATAIGHPPRGH